MVVNSISGPTGFIKSTVFVKRDTKTTQSFGHLLAAHLFALANQVINHTSNDGGVDPTTQGDPNLDISP